MPEIGMRVFTAYSLPSYIEWLRSTPHIDDGGDTVLTPHLVRVDTGTNVVYVHRADSSDSPLIMVSGSAISRIRVKGVHPLQRLLERVDRVAREFGTQRLSLPSAWNKYQYENKVALFALPFHLDQESLRWIAELLDGGNTCFWELTPAGSEKRLEHHVSNHTLTDDIRRTWPDALQRGHSQLPPADQFTVLQPAVDLDVVGGSAVSRERPYSVWEERLNSIQSSVLYDSVSRPLKIRGAAGTGKTLVLQLRALKEVYEAADRQERSPRVLYLTHSYTLADMVDRSLHAIDDRGLAPNAIDILPLTWVHELLYGNLPEGAEVLGDDSLDGKRRQLDLISAVIDDIVSTDWPTYRNGVSKTVAAGVESPPNAEPRLVLCWMLMREFAEVIDANRLKPGLNALQRYLELPRAAWMVYLPSRADREFAYAVYRRFVARLVDEGQLTTDQALDDFRKYLEGYAWNLRRPNDGYDLILVDEFHLFNDTERYLLHLLTRDPDSPPRLVLALDPHQSAFTLLTGLSVSSLSKQATQNLASEVDMGVVELRIIHRFSQEVLEFVRLIYDSFPNLVDIGEDWSVDLKSASSPSQSGSRPVVKTAASRVAAAGAALAMAKAKNEGTPQAERTALIGAGPDEFEALHAELPPGEPGRKFTTLRSREDIDQLRFSRRSLVLGMAEYCAGLQFAHVVVLAFADRSSSHGLGTSAARASLSELYLAITRAERSVTVVTSGDEGQVGQLLKRAIEQGLAVPAS